MTSEWHVIPTTWCLSSFELRFVLWLLALASQQGVKAKIMNPFIPITVTTKSLDDSAFSSELTGAISAASAAVTRKVTYIWKDYNFIDVMWSIHSSTQCYSTLWLTKPLRVLPRIEGRQYYNLQWYVPPPLIRCSLASSYYNKSLLFIKTN